MSLIKQARFYKFDDPKDVQHVTDDLLTIGMELFDYSNARFVAFDFDDSDDTEYASFLFDYNSDAERQLGFVSLYDGRCQSQTDEMLYLQEVNSWHVMAVLLREKKIDNSQLRKEVEKRSIAFRHQTGEEPTGKQRRELTEDVRRELLAKNATMKYRRALFGVKASEGLLFINNATPAFCESVTGFLRSVIGTLRIQPYPDIDMVDNINSRMRAAFEELEPVVLWAPESGESIEVKDWIKAEQSEEGKVTMKYAPDDVLESLIANQYRPIKYDLGYKSAENEVLFTYEDMKITKIKLDDVSELTMLGEDIMDDAVAQYHADLEIALGTLENVLTAVQSLGGDLDEEGDLGV